MVIKEVNTHLRKKISLGQHLTPYKKVHFSVHLKLLKIKHKNLKKRLELSVSEYLSTPWVKSMFLKF